MPTRSTDRRLPVGWWRLGTGILFAAWGMLISLAINTTEAPSTTVVWVHATLGAMAVVAIVLLGWPLLMDTVRAARRGKLTIEPLFVSALLGALGYSLANALRGSGAVYFETVIVVLVIYTIGTRLKGGARSRAEEALSRFTAPETRVRRLCGRTTEDIELDALSVGDIIEVAPGEQIPVDGEIVSGRALVEESAVSGEWRPRTRDVGDAVLAGSHPIDAMVRVRATCAPGESLLDRSLASSGLDIASRAHVVKRANSALRWFIPAVWLAAIATCLGWGLGGSWGDAVLNAMAVLLIACPCALGFATPTAVWAACNRFARDGVRVQHADIVEQLAHVTRVLIDKTGTITSPRPAPSAFEYLDSSPVDEPALRHLIACVERHSSHPLADVFDALHEGPVYATLLESRVIPGTGIRGSVALDGLTRDVWIGRSTDAGMLGNHDGDDERIAVLIDGEPAALVTLHETANSEWSQTIESLRGLGIRTTLITGDEATRAHAVEADEHLSRVTPEKKRDEVLRLRSDGERVLFVGDGLNDAAAMAASDASMAIDTGSSLSVTMSHAVLNASNLASIPCAISVARRADRVLKTNIALSIGYNTVGIGFASAGYLHPALAAVIMVASSLIVTSRALSVAEYSDGEHDDAVHQLNSCPKQPTGSPVSSSALVSRVFPSHWQVPGRPGWRRRLRSVFNEK